jgi:hypothetical protein
MKRRKHLLMAEHRLDRALLNLPRYLEMEAAARVGGSDDPEGPTVFLSRLIIALNTVASELHSAQAADVEAVASEAADYLWSIGERCGAADNRFRMNDAARPAVGK